ncbi:hypothetical protein H696_02230 [Fonticula alba]|uniref:Dipeptidyl-peptidase IV n=1 Tax=Fonticula alba TaxID=691883 RepID=A0A058ZAC3_FONAL|nr:hypothetical protein H696_02230 [Fonticula alba]KCV71284.1 hypothetical protein H696_02230 [Fonticula alba]|eukprot:XP_009494407.1 hypothetical protein H696_02230 [Fonticula alba]
MGNVRRSSIEWVPSSSYGTEFGFNDIFNSTFQPVTTSVRWVSGSVSTHRDASGNIMLTRFPTVEPEVFLEAASVINPDTNEPLSFFNYWISPDEQFVLLATERVGVWRHSFTAFYFVHSMVDGTTRKLDAERLQHVSWAPTGHRLVFVKGNDIFLLKDVSGNLSDTDRVTHDGSLNILNGVPSWVYEEQVFGHAHSIWWNTDGTQFAFMRSDETDVPTFHLTRYGNTDYPSHTPVKYPKVGYPNPIVQMSIMDVDSGTIANVDFERDDEFIIVDVAWSNPARMVVRVTDRIQTQADLYTVSHERPTAQQISSQARAKGWVDYFSILTVPATDAAAERYVDIIEVNGYNHLALFSFDSPKPVRHLTSGEWEVTAYAAFDPETGTIFYFSTENGAIERNLYSVNLDASIPKRHITAEQPGWYTASFSPDAKFYLLNYRGPSVPTQHIYSTADPAFRHVVQENRALAELLSTYAMPQVHYTKLRIGDYDLDVSLTAPAGFDFNSSKKHPMLLHVYGGPDSQMVTREFPANDWHTYLVSSLGYIIVRADARGTRGRGNVFKNSVYLNLGDYEVADQIAVAEHFSKARYVDPKRVFVWGWSYGGYMTSKILERDAGSIIRKGVAVAPVTDWRFYDTIYTERFMSTPQLNGEKYKSSALTKFDSFKNVDYFLIHGTDDDNVHFQQAVVFSNNLTQASVRFEQHYYTDSDHRVNTGARTQPDLYSRITDFLEEKVGVAEEL